MVLEGNWKDPPWVSVGKGFGGHVRNCGPKCNGTRGARNSVCLNDHKPEMTRVTSIYRNSLHYRAKETRDNERLAEKSPSKRKYRITLQNSSVNVHVSIKVSVYAHLHR